MISGKKRILLSTETILQKITEYDIFRLYFPGNWKINQVTHSPFRNDRNPSFMIGNKLGNLHFIDYADTSLRGGCFDYVQKIYDISLHEALLKIDRDFGLGLSNAPVKDYKKIVSEYKQPEELGKRYSLIQVVTRKFTKEELSYWNLFHQDIIDLQREEIYSIKKLYLNKSLFTLKDTELRFAYHSEGNFKIYRPFAEKKNKWVPNNIPIDVLEGKNNIKNCDIAFITKSRKDRMVLQKIYECVCSVQNEGIACFSPENVQFLKENSKRQILGFDSDDVGKQNSIQITKMFDFDYCNVPNHYLTEDINDFAGLAKKYGLEKLKEIINKKLIL